jgi:hypothetical protein
MNRKEWLLTQAASEANEFAHAVTKAQQFGLNTVEPGQTKTNEQRLVLEFIDLLATNEILEEEGIITLPSTTEIAHLIEKKRDKVEKHYKIARDELGTVVEDKPQPASQPSPSEEKDKTIQDAINNAYKILENGYNIHKVNLSGMKGRNGTESITSKEMSALVILFVQDTLQEKGSW